MLYIILCLVINRDFFVIDIFCITCYNFYSYLDSYTKSVIKSYGSLVLVEFHYILWMMGLQHHQRIVLSIGLIGFNIGKMKIWSTVY